MLTRSLRPLTLQFILAGALLSAEALGQSRTQEPPPNHTNHPPASAAPAAKPLAMGDLESLALAYHPALARLAAQSDAVQGRAFQAGLRPNPSVGYTADEIGEDGTAGLHGIFAEQKWVAGGKLVSRRDAMLRQADVVDARLAATRQRVVNGVRNRYMNVLYFQKLVAIREKLLNTAREGESTARQLRNIGRANRPAELLALIELRQATTAFEEAKIQRETAWRELVSFVGRADLPVTELQGDLEASPPKAEQLPTVEHILAESPEAQGAFAEIARSQAGVNRELAERSPDVDIRLGTQYSFESSRQVALAEIGVPLPIFNRNQGNIQAAQAEVTSAQAAAQEIDLDIRRRYARAHARFKSAALAVESYRTQLSDATEAHGLYREAVDARMASYEQVLTAQRTLFQLSIAYQQALRQLWQADVELRGWLIADEAAPEGENGRSMSETRSYSGAPAD
jgi:cobalt-zinc-cadmium efflux system outer membrane protein